MKLKFWDKKGEDTNEPPYMPPIGGEWFQEYNIKIYFTPKPLRSNHLEESTSWIQGEGFTSFGYMINMLHLN